MSTHVDSPPPPNIAQTASDTLQSQINLAPQQFAASSIYDPQYAQLYGNILNQSLLGSPDYSSYVKNDPTALAAFNAQTDGGITDMGTFGKQYATQNNVATSAIPKNGGLLDTYSQAAPAMQDIQSKLNTQQLQSNLGNLQTTLPSMVSSLSSANPQLQSIQNQMTQNALAGAPAAGMITAAQAGQAINPLQALGSWNDPRMQIQAQSVNPTSVSGSDINYNLQSPGMVRAQGNPALGQLNQTTQQQLALGGSLDQGTQDQIANSTMSYFNQMGRSADPIDAANLALNMDSAQQARLAQREQAASSVAGLNQTQSAQNLQAQQLNQSANMQMQGLGLGQATTQAQLGQQANLANQSTNLAGQQLNQAAGLQAQTSDQNAFLASQGINLQGASTYANLNNQVNLSNAQMQQQASLANQNQQYQNSIFNQNQLQQAYQSQMGTTMPAISAALSSTLGPASGLGASMQGLGQASGFPTTGGSNFNPYPTASNLYGQYYTGQMGANVANANNNAGLIGGGMSLLGSAAGAKIMFMCIPEGETVDTENGPVAVESIRAGDCIIGYDGKAAVVTQKQEYAEDPKAKRFLRFKLSNGKSLSVCDMHRIGGIRAGNYSTNSVMGGETVISIAQYDGVRRSYDLLTEDGGYRMSGIPVDSMIVELALLTKELAYA